MQGWCRRYLLMWRMITVCRLRSLLIVAPVVYNNNYYYYYYY